MADDLRKKVDGVYLSNKLVGLDNHLNKLFDLFEQLQLATVETCHPRLDLITFAESAYYFAAILKVKERPPKPKAAPLPLMPPAVLAVRSPKHTGGLHNSAKRKMSIEEDNYLKADTSPKRHHQNKESPFANTIDNMSSTSQTKVWSEYSFDYTVTTTKETAPDQYRDLPDPESHIPDQFIFTDEEEFEEEVLGLIYLVPINSFPDDPLHVAELNLGVIIDPQHQGKGYARHVVDLVLQKAFRVHKCHRVQAILPDHVAKDSAICFFTQMRFDHEGTRRRAFFSPMEGVYKDVTYMGILDTDWALRCSDGARVTTPTRPAPKSVWDELFARHQREREELLNWESVKDMKLSTTLIRAQTPTQNDFRNNEANGDAIDAGSAASRGSGKGKQKADQYRETTYDTDTESEDGFYVSLSDDAELGTERKRAHFTTEWTRESSPNSEDDTALPSSESESESSDALFIRSVSPSDSISAGSTSSSSTWDVVEPSDSESEISRQGSPTTSIDLDEFDDTFDLVAHVS